MKIVLLSGGSGKRLWPLSNDSRSKQFLKILKNGDGGLESMIQRVWGQLEDADLRQHAYVATSKPQVEMIYSQLGSEINMIVEPERRDTFPAIALAATYLYSIEGVNLGETIVVMPVDPYVETSFFHALKQLEQVLDNSDADLALMGVKPTYPSEKYGYIIPKEESDDQPFLGVQSFREKPRKEEAEDMIRQDALWNCGVFAFKLDFIINILIASELPIQYEEMLKRYAKLPKISFDYEVVERANRVAAVRYDGPWKDLGTWNTLTEEIETRLIGKGIITDDATNTHVINELDIPITLMGLTDVIVAASPDGILVSDKASSPMIKEVMKHSDQRPMYEERRWGRYRVLDFIKYPDGREVLTKRIFISAGKNLSYQYHSLRDEVWTVISGSGEMVFNEHRFTISEGQVLTIPREYKHSLRAETDIEIIEVQTGSQLIEEDIVRLEHEWSEIVQLCKV
ncbi:sugar phosphate nucleotidyltransferase [Paenibacillus glycinis]|uniref:Cupin domain-containing protein n=1 Tax=Paenibacillus glycinis TaxID=2697035 RepID=A0ABW9XV48_9BACL|nr:sugar phosphate nucleotidyltransferase [Paenibacillus glycinis]NBD26343.1 cupin domain-containing protein [Paenibacillus glycinis]